MTLEWWADLVTVVVGIAVVIPLLYHLFRLEWRWRLGTWAGALRSDWGYRRWDHDRSTGEARQPRLYWTSLEVLDWVILKRLSCLASPRWEVTVWSGYSPGELRALADVKVDPEEEVDPEEHEVDLRLARAHMGISERRRRRRHRNTACNCCGRRWDPQFSCEDSECTRHLCLWCKKVDATPSPT